MIFAFGKGCLPHCIWMVLCGGYPIVNITENSRRDCSMPFLDILITPKEDGRLSTSVYRKPTHIDLYEFI